MADNMTHYDSRDIVEKYLHHKLLKKGVFWEFNATGRHDGDNNPSSSSSNSGVVWRRLQSGVVSSSSYHEEEGNSRQDSRDAPNQQNLHATPPPAPPGQQQAQSARLQRVLCEAGEELEQMYQRDFLTHLSGQFLHFTPRTARRCFTTVSEELFRDGINWGRIVAFFEFGGAMCVASVNREMAAQVDNITAWMTECLNTPPLQGWIEENGGWDVFVELYDQPRAVTGSWSMSTLFGLAALGAAGITLGALFTLK